MDISNLLFVWTGRTSASCSLPSPRCRIEEQVGRRSGRSPVTRPHAGLRPPVRLSAFGSEDLHRCQIALGFGGDVCWSLVGHAARVRGIAHAGLMHGSRAT